MPTALVLRHVHFEDLGAFAAPMRAAGCRARILDVGVDALRPGEVEAADLLVVLGGPVAAYKAYLYPFLAEELALLRTRLAAGSPASSPSSAPPATRSTMMTSPAFHPSCTPTSSQTAATSSHPAKQVGVTPPGC